MTLTLSSSTATKMQFSSDGSTWSAKQDYVTSSSYTLAIGRRHEDRLRPVLAGARTSVRALTDTIILDTTAPNAPTSLTGVVRRRSADQDVTLQWTAPSPLSSDHAGYRIYYRRPTSDDLLRRRRCTFVTATEVHPDRVTRNTTYLFYVVSYDLAGNQSAASNTDHVTP